ncbi:MAG: hypothetical protein ACLKAK_05825 [Alkaliphilus sp.]
MKRMMSLLLVLTMVFTVIPSYAMTSDINSMIEDPMIEDIGVLEREVDEDGNIIKSVCIIEGAVYLYEIVGDLAFSIGVYENNIADIAVKEISTGKIYADVIKIEDMPQYNKMDNNRNKIDKIKSDLLKGDLVLLSIDMDKHITKNFKSSRSFSNEDKIMDRLYNVGWPHAYSSYLRSSRTENGAYAELRHSVSYSIKEKDSKMIVAGTTLSIIVLYYTWPAILWQQIASVALVGGGVYEAVNSFAVADYNVYCYGNKFVYVNGGYQYQAGRTVKWKAVVADIGASLDFSYDNHHHDYFDNEGLLDTGLYNYFN